MDRDPTEVSLPPCSSPNRLQQATWQVHFSCPCQSYCCAQPWDLLDKEDTGERIVNGVPCTRGSNPWQVALFNGNEMDCSGVLIHQQWVLTVAHCHRHEYTVHMGSDLLNGPNAQKIRATESFVYPYFSWEFQSNDIMLVKLSRPAKLSSTVRKVNIPSQCVRPGTTCTVSGWGTITSPEETYPSQLMCTNVTTISTEECLKYFVHVEKYRMVCGGTQDSTSNANQGDSGGPLMCSGSLRGLVSRKPLSLFRRLNPVVFTQICKYRKWIYDTMRENS
ncbi:kallikrein-7-like isoform X1 [Saccopteryx bilineata]|uniref:kallikrein-7-like isoform X1 n=1 Tax=Saccopteryx bilineata TaxID=59482 RepID=UPI00338DDA3C